MRVIELPGGGCQHGLGHRDTGSAERTRALRRWVRVSNPTVLTPAAQTAGVGCLHCFVTSRVLLFRVDVELLDSIVTNRKAP